MTTASDGLVWVFNDGGVTIKAHRDGCAALRRVKRPAVCLRDEADKADLLERGYPVTVCRCAK